MKAALQMHWKRISDDYLHDRVFPVLGRLGIEHELLPFEHDGDTPLAPDTDFILVLGGDGTFLTGAALALNSGLPIIGVMVGRLGFLCSITMDNLEQSLRQIIEGTMPLEHRYALSGSIIGHDDELKCVRQAINDVVVFRKGNNNIRDFNAWHDGELIANYRADGIIVSSAVGSTAYTLAAGGPLVHPALDVMVLTPICAHSLFTKPLVLPRGSQIEITVRAGSFPLEVHFDGNCNQAMEEGERIRITSADQPLKVYRPEGHGFYSVLQQKFQHGFLYGEQDVITD